MRTSFSFGGRNDRQRTLVIRIAAITLASDSAITNARFRPSKQRTKCVLQEAKGPSKLLNLKCFQWESWASVLQLYRSTWQCRCMCPKGQWYICLWLTSYMRLSSPSAALTLMRRGWEHVSWQRRWRATNDSWAACFKTMLLLTNNEVLLKSHDSFSHMVTHHTV